MARPRRPAVPATLPPSVCADVAHLHVHTHARAFVYRRYPARVNPVELHLDGAIDALEARAAPESCALCIDCAVLIGGSRLSRADDGRGGRQPDASHRTSRGRGSPYCHHAVEARSVPAESSRRGGGRIAAAEAEGSGVAAEYADAVGLAMAMQPVADDCGAAAAVHPFRHVRRHGLRVPRQRLVRFLRVISIRWRRPTHIRNIQTINTC